MDWTVDFARHGSVFSCYRPPRAACRSTCKLPPRLDTLHGYNLVTQGQKSSRHGAFAHLDRLLVRHSEPIYRHREWLAFLEAITKNLETQTDVYVLMERHSRSTQKHWRVRAWLRGHPKVSCHYVDGNDWLKALKDFLLDLGKVQSDLGSLSSASAASSSYYSCVRRAYQEPGLLSGLRPDGAAPW